MLISLNTYSIITQCSDSNARALPAAPAALPVLPMPPAVRADGGAVFRPPAEKPGASV